MKHLSLKLLICLVLVSAVSAWAIYWHRPFRARMGAYVTDLKDRSPAQRKNILRAGRAISGTVIPSGGVFSLNEQAGPYTLARGFRPERSFRGKQVIFTPGGGVCQVAGTLYNTARIAELEIIERVPHTQTVASLPKGQDATLAFGVADLKFRNNYPYPIKILSRPLGDQLLIEIWGKEQKHGSTEL